MRSLKECATKYKRLSKITSMFGIVILCIVWQPSKQSSGQKTKAIQPNATVTPKTYTEIERKNLALKATIKKNDDSIKAIIATDNKSVQKTKIIYRWRTRYLPAKAAARDTIYVTFPLEIEDDYILDTPICRIDTVYLIAPKKKKRIRIF